MLSRSTQALRSRRDRAWVAWLIAAAGLLAIVYIFAQMRGCSLRSPHAGDGEWFRDEHDPARRIQGGT